MRFLIRLALVTLTIALQACAAGQVDIEDLDMPVIDLHKAISEALPVKERGQSPSGREIKSVYFIQKKGEFIESEGSPTRMFIHIAILNDRRPYTLRVEVPVETRVSEGRYEIDHNDEGLARVISRRIQKVLHERRDNRNAIDDFRVF